MRQFAPTSTQLFGSPLDFLARHASEQYFTSSQFFAQLLRQVIARPHVTQILLGRPALLPLKPDWDAIKFVLLVQRVAVVMRICAVVAAAQLHGYILVGKGNALNAQEGRAVLYFQ